MFKSIYKSLSIALLLTSFSVTTYGMQSSQQQQEDVVFLPIDERNIPVYQMYGGMSPITEIHPYNPLIGGNKFIGEFVLANDILKKTSQFFGNEIKNCFINIKSFIMFDTNTTGIKPENNHPLLRPYGIYRGDNLTETSNINKHFEAMLYWKDKRIQSNGSLHLHPGTDFSGNKISV